MSVSECIFCRIAAGDIPSGRVYEDDLVVAFRDIAPLAPTHVLIIPRQHVESIHSTDLDGETVLAMVRAVQQIAEHEGIHESGYRVATNVGEHGGQSVFHLHWHLLGGASLGAMG